MVLIVIKNTAYNLNRAVVKAPTVTDKTNTSQDKIKIKA